jgi:hypothetical protein
MKPTRILSNRLVREGNGLVESAERSKGTVVEGSGAKGRDN